MASSRVPVRAARLGAGSRQHAGGSDGAWRLVTLLAAVALFAPLPARATEAPASPPRVLLLDAPAALERALRTALVPWGMQVDVHAEASDAEGLAESSARASALARANSATALVWLEDTSERRRLWLFDASTGTITSRDVPRGALTRALAAALALSIKTQLRGGETPAERQVSSEPATATNSAAAPRVTAALPPPSIDARDVLRSEPIGRHAPSWQFLLLAALRRGALDPGATEPRYGAELRWAPELPWRSDFAALWFGAHAELGVDQDIVGPSFEGQYSEIGAGLSVGLTRRLSQLFSTGLEISVSLHSASLQGTLLPDTALEPETRLGSALRVRPEMGLSLGAIGFVVQPALGATLGRQSFVVKSEQEEPATGVSVLETRPVWWMIGVGASVSIE